MQESIPWEVDTAKLSETLCEPPGSPRGLFDRLKYVAEVVEACPQETETRPWLAYRRADRTVGSMGFGETGLTVGRQAEDGLQLEDDPGLSRQHFSIDPAADEYAIKDAGSLNGTRVNGEPLHRQRILVSGDVIEAGSTVFVFVDLRGH